MLMRILFNLDKVANGLSGGNFGHTISHRSAAAAQRGSVVGQGLCHALDAVDKGHCAKSLSEVASTPFSAKCLRGCSES